MIYEVRTYDLKPGSVPEAEKRFGEAYEKRKAYSPLAVFWHTEIGPLNQIIHVWPYKDLEERAKIRAAAVKEGAWPPKISEFIVRQHVDIMVPFDVSPEIKPGKQGPYFEMRTYTFAGGELPKIKSLWAKALPTRLQFGPVTAVWSTEIGHVNRFCHIWPYPTLDARDEIRKKAQTTGGWPPSAVAKKEGIPSYQLVAQENKIVVPSSFSPLQ